MGYDLASTCWVWSLLTKRTSLKIYSNFWFFGWFCHKIHWFFELFQKSQNQATLIHTSVGWFFLPKRTFSPGFDTLINKFVMLLWCEFESSSSNFYTYIFQFWHFFFFKFKYFWARFKKLGPSSLYMLHNPWNWRL